VWRGRNAIGRAAIGLWVLGLLVGIVFGVRALVTGQSEDLTLVMVAIGVMAIMLIAGVAALFAKPFLPSSLRREVDKEGTV